MADGLRLKVSQAEYERRIGVLDSKISALGSLLTEYEQLEREADKVMGDGDNNLRKLKLTVEKNIKAVRGQQEMVKQSREMLQKQMNDLGMLSTNVENMFDEAMQTAKTAFNTIKIVGDLVD